MNLMAILIATLAAGVGSVWLAAVLSFGVLARYTQHMLSLAAGALLSTALLNLLPEAFESQASAHDLFGALLGGLIFFFLLDKAELYHHGHEHGHGHGPGHAGHDHSGGGWAVLAGDSLHSFGDGILIASAFMASPRLGLMAAVSVLAHEVPHHMGDLMVLGAGNRPRQAALIKVSLAGAMTAIGGLAGWLLIGQLEQMQPYILAIASSSFIYVALADLIPQLQKRLLPRETAAQVAWLAAGLVLVLLVGALGGGHSH